MFYLRVLLAVDGTEYFGQAIRWHYLFGDFGKDPKATKKFERVDKKNFKKWQEKTGKSYDDYLNVVRV